MRVLIRKGLTTMQKLKEKMTSALSLPKEIALDFPVVTATGRGELVVENYKNLLEFADAKIRIRTSESIITIEGERLTLQQITTENLSVAGRIVSISYE